RSKTRPFGASRAAPSAVPWLTSTARLGCSRSSSTTGSSLQFPLASRCPEHPCHHLSACPAPRRRMKPSIFTAPFFDDSWQPVTAPAVIDDAAAWDRARRAQNSLIVLDYIDSLPPNRVVGLRPDICESERSLPRRTFCLLAQLRSGFSPLLRIYQHRLNPETPPSCPEQAGVTHHQPEGAGNLGQQADQVQDKQNAGAESGGGANKSNKAAAHSLRSSSQLNSATLGLVQAILHVVPVDHLPDALDVVWANVLVLQVVGVLPHVYAQQRLQACGGLQRILECNFNECRRSGLTLVLTDGSGQELTGGSGLALVLTGGSGLALVLTGGNLQPEPGWLATALRAEVLPEDAVVHVTAAIEPQSRLDGNDSGSQGLLGGVEIVHIGGVVLLMVQTHDIGADDRLQGAVVVGQVGQDSLYNWLRSLSRTAERLDAEPLAQTDSRWQLGADAVHVGAEELSDLKVGSSCPSCCNAQAHCPEASFGNFAASPKSLQWQPNLTAKPECQGNSANLTLTSEPLDFSSRQPPVSLTSAINRESSSRPATKKQTSCSKQRQQQPDRVRRRHAANDRERRRMNALNAAFDQLRAAIPAAEGDEAAALLGGCGDSDF
uniref:BHLH domain-containing protein n=1 Tax=Macrostomum lignano TaxID=282301 RepID=A0A1I8HEJ3_9PLAT